MALALILGQLKKPVTIVMGTPISAVFGNVLGNIEIADSLPQDADLNVIVDCAELQRTGFALGIKKSNAKLVIIDHHAVEVRPKADILLSSVDVAATAELIYELANELRVTITQPIATALLMGIYTDTGGFVHGNATSETLKISSRLMRYGANLEKIASAFSHRLPSAKKRLWGLALTQIKMNTLGFVVAKITKEMLVETNATADDLSGLANFLALTSEARVALVMAETDDGWRGVLRTRKPDVNLHKLAKLFGGKGHRKAAGFSTTKDIFSGKM
jgi:phosphoesterase RecJ-like protein